MPHISQIFSPVFTKFGNSRQISQGQHLSDAGLSSWIKCARVMSLGKMRLDNYYMILRTRITLLCGCSGDMSNTFCSISLDVEKSSVFFIIFKSARSRECNAKLCQRLNENLIQVDWCVRPWLVFIQCGLFESSGPPLLKVRTLLSFLMLRGHHFITQLVFE